MTSAITLKGINSQTIIFIDSGILLLIQLILLVLVILIILKIIKIKRR